MRILKILLLALLAGLLAFIVFGRSRLSADAPTDAAAASAAPAAETAEPTPVPTPTPTPDPYADGIDLLGKHYAENASAIDLSGISAEADIALFEAAAPYFTELKDVELGAEESTPVSWETIERLQKAAPQADFHYSFSLYGEAATLDDETIDLRKIKIGDNGEAVCAALKCMKKCTYLDLDESGLDSTRCAEIRDRFPDVKVVWRVTFGTMNYSVRTDVKTILASLSGVGDYAGLTNEESCLPLTYCTDVINLDLGHNSNLRTLSFLKYMPNLEVFVTYEDYLRDVDDLKYATHLRYLELYASSMYNIDAIGELYELTDLMLCACYNLNSIAPIVPADKVPNLQRLYLTGGLIPQSEIDEFQKNHPNCEVNTTDNSAISSWRWIDPVHVADTVENRTPCYARLCEIFHYKEDNRIMYNFTQNDPYLNTPHGQEVTGVQLDWFYGTHHFDPYGIYGDGD